MRCDGRSKRPSPSIQPALRGSSPAIRSVLPRLQRTRLPNPVRAPVSLPGLSPGLAGLNLSGKVRRLSFYTPFDPSSESVAPVESDSTRADAPSQRIRQVAVRFGCDARSTPRVTTSRDSDSGPAGNYPLDARQVAR